MTKKEHVPDPVESIDEHALNPPPFKYSVSFRCKVIFLAAFLIGLGFYFYLIVERRVSQNRFILQNQMAAVKLVPELLPELVIAEVPSGADAELKTYLGKWVLLNLWATWCPPCKEEMPSLALLQQKYGDKLSIIALSVDDNLEAVNEYVSANRPKFTVLWDRYKNSPKLFGVDKYPETFLISPDGIPTVQFSGPRNWSSQSAIDYFDSIIGQKN